MEYQICEADSAKKLTNQVSDLIQAGWRPKGGVAVAHSDRSDRWWYYQAVVREGKPTARGFDDLE